MWNVLLARFAPFEILQVILIVVKITESLIGFLYGKTVFVFDIYLTS